MNSRHSLVSETDLKAGIGETWVQIYPNSPEWNKLKIRKVTNNSMWFINPANIKQKYGLQSTAVVSKFQCAKLLET